MSHTTRYLLGSIEVESLGELKKYIRELADKMGYHVYEDPRVPSLFIETADAVVEIIYDSETKRIWARHPTHVRKAYKLANLVKNYIRAKIAEEQAKKLYPYAITRIRTIGEDMVELEVSV